MGQYRALFRNRNYVLLWIGGAISNIGDFFNSVALIKILSEDPAHLGFLMSLIMVAKVVPGVVLGPIAGVVADRLPRKTIMIVSDLLRTLLVLGLVFTNSPAAIVTLVFLAAAVSVFFNPASSALLPNIVKSDELVTAGSLNVMTGRMAMLIGSGLGAAILMAVGPHQVFLIDAASFVVSAACTALMRLRASAATTAHKESSLWQTFASDLAETVAFLRQSAPMRHMSTTLSIACFGDSALNVLLITFFTVGLGLAAEQYGFISAIFAGAAVLGALGIGAVGNKIHWRHLISGGAVYLWFTMMGALVVHRLVPSTVFFALVGLGSGGINVGVQAAVGVLVPDQVRGRVFAGFGMIQNLIFVVGSLAAGSLSDRFGPTNVLLCSTTFYLAAGIYAHFTLRQATAEPAEPVLEPAVSD